ncbi:hypothetical protein TNIN_198491 [Trichonephila inaurata madagascariensis]|uniref:Uncharacterized protein n=1 Tax=Trichonephila inaurata madagascariensis TaxID=2747483 RepID=A0A8X7CSQ8_9ARAC|nr:hypothetical protein TNIN_198491 [Trichonephila inaurata madagascariensis]
MNKNSMGRRRHSPLAECRVEAAAARDVENTERMHATSRVDRRRSTVEVDISRKACRDEVETSVEVKRRGSRCKTGGCQRKLAVSNKDSKVEDEDEEVKVAAKDIRGDETRWVEKQAADDSMFRHQFPG